jgi:hypothetical protein
MSHTDKSCLASKNNTERCLPEHSTHKTAAPTQQQQRQQQQRKCCDTGFSKSFAASFTMLLSLCDNGGTQQSHCNGTHNQAEEAATAASALYTRCSSRSSISSSELASGRTMVFVCLGCLLRQSVL